MKFIEHYKRSLAKALTFRGLALITNFLIIAEFTGQRNLAITIVIIANLINTVLYFIHERVWNHIHWGKHQHKAL